MFDHPGDTPIVKINDPILDKSGIELCIKREDLLDQYISGNKFRKLKFNLIEAKSLGHHTLLTFGGAYSNHIHALAYAGYMYNFKTIGIIRGEETLPLNPTLNDAREFGMQLFYISRTAYRNKEHPDFLRKLVDDFGEFYLVPEGGSNTFAVRGCTEIINESVSGFDHICCAVGTGGTLAGIIAGMNDRKNVLGFPVLKNGGFLVETITRLIGDYNNKSFKNWQLMLNYHFGGYAKFDHSLVRFINQFKKSHQISLDPVYTGKLLFGIYDLAHKGFFRKGDRILAIHTGGLQGIAGFNQRHRNIIE
jgi:1-aminocyclopropane-1-carboxylate deaminase/D-cysteine desulfhydrase-like pyridoxal-dependent ACC family enzyme